MRTVTVQQDCSAPVEDLWRLATDLQNAPDVIPAITATTVHTDGEFGVGTRWTETRTMFGRAADETMTVTAVEPGRSYTAEAESSGMHYVTRWDIDPTDAGSRVTMTFSGEPTGTVGRLLSPVMTVLMSRSVESAMRTDMAALAAAAEQRAGR